jgi:hypothetical protein
MNRVKCISAVVTCYFKNVKRRNSFQGIMKYRSECLVLIIGHTAVAAHGFLKKKLSKVSAILLLLTNNPRSTLWKVVGICIGRVVITTIMEADKGYVAY